MGKDTEESTEQSNQKADSELTSPILEPTIPEPLVNADEPDDQAIHVTLAEIRLSESVPIDSALSFSIGYPLDSDVHKSVDEFKDIEVDLSEEEENSDCQSVIKCETKASKTNPKMCSSKTLSPQLGSASSTAEKDVPTHQASGTTLSTSNTMSNSLAVSSGLVSIPSTSRDSSSGLAAEGYSRKRPTDLGLNLRKKIHVFDPRSPCVLRRYPVPIRDGQWVHLPDSPESSDYGGSPDSLDDHFLTEDVYLSTPENEMEDLDTPQKETCSGSRPPLNSIETDSSSESGLIEGSIEDHPSDFGHIKTNIEANPSEVSHVEKTGGNASDSGHIKSTIGGFSFDSDQIEGCTEDESDNVNETVADLPSEVSHTENTFHDISSRIQIEKNVKLQSESGHVEERFNPELEVENIGNILIESDNIESSISNSSPELEQCKENIENPSQSDNID